MIFGRKSESTLEVGQAVMTADEEHLGAISAIDDDSIEITSDTVGSQQIWRVPRSAVARSDEQEAQLSLSRVQMMTRAMPPSNDTVEDASSRL